MARPKQRGMANPKIDSLPPTPEDWVSQGGDEVKQPPEEEPKKRITLTVTEELHKKVHIYARTQGVTVTALITEFLEKLTS